MTGHIRLLQRSSRFMASSMRYLLKLNMQFNAEPNAPVEQSGADDLVHRLVARIAHLEGQVFAASEADEKENNAGVD